MKTERYSAIAIVLHWITAALIIGMLILGEDMVSPRDGATDFTRSVHASIGTLILLLTFMRLGWRFIKPAPALPVNMTGLELKAAKATHHLFYVLLLALPLTGWLAASALTLEHGTNFTVFGFALPVLPLPDLGELYEALHGIPGKLMWALLALHIIGAVKHQFWDGHKAYLSRMGLGRAN